MSKATTKAKIAQLTAELADLSVSPARIAEIMDEILELQRPYKVFSALISQGGVNPPNAVILENTFGVVPVFTRANVGSYDLQFPLIDMISDKLHFLSDLELRTGSNNLDSVYIEHYAFQTDVATGNAKIVKKDSFFTKSIEIRLYN